MKDKIIWPQEMSVGCWPWTPSHSLYLLAIWKCLDKSLHEAFVPQSNLMNFLYFYSLMVFYVLFHLHFIYRDIFSLEKLPMNTVQIKMKMFYFILSFSLLVYFFVSLQPLISPITPIFYRELDIDSINKEAAQLWILDTSVPNMWVSSIPPREVLTSLSREKIYIWGGNS